jgi:hypothetical protein
MEGDYHGIAFFHRCQKPEFGNFDNSFLPDGVMRRANLAKFCFRAN